MHFLPRPLFFCYSVFFAEGLSLFANTLVFYLALTETNHDLVEYRSILVANCIVDYTCTFVNLLNQAHLEFVNELWVQVIEGPVKYLPRNILIMSVGSHSFMIGFGVISLPICVPGSSFISCATFSHNICILPLSCYCWINLSICFYMSDWKFKEHSFLHNNSYIFNEHNPHPVILIGEMKSNGMLLHTVMACLCTLATGLPIWYFSVDTYLTLKKSKATMHKNTQRLQQQMNRMLFVQTTAVFVSVILPVCLHLTMMVFDLKISGLGTLTNSFISFIPTLNPICMLALVSRLRNRALQFLCCRKRLQVLTDVSSSAANQTAL